MTTSQQTLLSRYQYDPLDRLADCEATGQTATRRFYLKDRLTTEIQGPVQRSMFQHDDQLLAQQLHENDAVETALLATDQQRSVLQLLDATQPHPLAYTPYGHRPADNGLLSLLGFNGERPDPVTGHYLLGNGYRAFNPGLMRFNSPDSLSPFGEGGVNAYAYCVGDPVNRTDPTGHFPNLWKALLNVLKLRTPSTRAATSVQSTAVSAANAVPSQNIATVIPPPGYSVGNLNGLRPPLQRGAPPAYRSLPPDYADHRLGSRIPTKIVRSTFTEPKAGPPPTYGEAVGFPQLFKSRHRGGWGSSSSTSSSGDSWTSSSGGSWTSRSSLSSQDSYRPNTRLPPEQIARNRAALRAWAVRTENL